MEIHLVTVRSSALGFLTDLAAVGPQPAVYWVLWHLTVFSAGQLSCSRSRPLVP